MIIALLFGCRLRVRRPATTWGDPQQLGSFKVEFQKKVILLKLDLEFYYSLNLEIAFENKSIRAICEDEESASEKYGEAVSKKLKTRLADLRAANSIADVVAGNPREIESGKKQIYIVDLANGHRLIFCSNHVRSHSSESENMNLAKISRIKILNIDNQ